MLLHAMTFLQITLTLHAMDGSKEEESSAAQKQAQAADEDLNEADAAAAESVTKTTDLDITNIAHLIKKHGPLGALKHVISYGENVGIGSTTLCMTAISISRHQHDGSNETKGSVVADKNTDSSLRIYMAASKPAAERHKVDKQTLLQFVRNCVLFKVCTAASIAIKNNLVHLCVCRVCLWMQPTV